MKILFINLSDHAIPPPNNVIRADLYISVSLAEELQQRGHDIHFLCPKGSTVKTKKIFTSTGPLVSVIPLEIFSSISDFDVRSKILHTFYFDLYLKLLEVVRQEKFDLIHFHTNVPMSELVVLNRINLPCLFTLHSVSLLPEIENKVIETFNKRVQNYFVSISHYQQSTFTALKFIANIYHGLILNKFLFEEEGTESLIFAGRLRRTKGLKEAIIAAIKTNHKLIITGARSSTDTQYFDAEVKPLLEKEKDLVTFLPHIKRNMIYGFYSQGRATMFPVLWEEPFGLVMVESMACGTPVIAFARGSVPEVILDGVTGFIVNSSDNDIRGNWIIKKTGVDGLCEAVEKIYSMPKEEYLQMRKNARAHVEKNFTVERMTNEYEKVYEKILSGNLR